MESPFPYDRLPTHFEFFGRSDELAKLSSIVDFSNNALVFSKRRMGKSSLIKELFENYKEKAICIYVDIFDITTKEDFASEMLRSLAVNRSKKFDLKGAIKDLARLFRRVRFEPTVDTNTLEYSIRPIVATLSFDEMISEFFASIDELANESKVIIAIDEFQQIASINDAKIDALIRKHLQNRKNISYIFLGSKRHLLTSLFAYKAPLYEMANHIELGALKLEDIESYAGKFITLDDNIYQHIYEISDKETKLIQQILHILYIKKSKIEDKSAVDEVVNEIVNSKDSSYRLLFDTFSNNQKIALKAVGKYKTKLFAQSVLDEFRIKKQTLQSALETLSRNEIIDKEDESYFIPDRTLELWVERLVS